MVCPHDTLLVVLSILMPHRYFGLWTLGLGWLNVTVDALILLAYFSIPIALVYFVRNRRDITLAWMFVCLGVFVLASGITFLMEIWNARHSHYWLSSAIKAVAVLAAVPTAILLARLIPALRASEERFRSYFELGLIGAAITSPTKGWVEINDEICRILGYERSELLRMTWAELTHPDDLAADVAYFNRVLAGEIESYVMDKRFIRKDGRVIDATISVRCLRRADGSVDYFVALVQDITERKLAERALRESEERMRAVLESALDCIITMDHHGRVVEFNPAAEKTFGYKRDAAIGQLLADLIIPPALRERHRRGLERYLSTGEGSMLGRRIELTGMRSDHSEFPVELAITRVGSQEPPMFTGFIRDITERKQAEEALAAQVLRYKTLMETSTDSIYVLDEEGDLQEANAAFLRRRGYTAAEVEGLNVADWDARYGREQIQERMRKLAGSSAVFETRHRCKDGSIFDVEVCATSVRIGGKPLFFVVTRDITERKQAEDRLRRSEEKFKALFGIAPVGISVLDRQHNIADANPALERIVRLSREELLGGAYRRRSYLNADGTPKPSDELPSERAVTKGQTLNDYEVGIVTENGEVIWTQVSVAPLALPEASAVVITQDITERKRAEQALRESEERFRELAENINEVFWTWTATPGNAQCLYVSSAYATIWGRSCESLYSSPQSWKEALHPQDKEWVLQEIARLDLEKISDWTYRIVRPDQSIRWIRDRIFPVRDVFGAVVRFAGIAEDITERRIAEEELKKEKEILAKVFDNIPVMIGFVGADGVKRVNPEWERTMGWTLKELQDQSVDIFVDAYPDLSYRQEVLDFVAAATGEWADLKIKVRDGRVIDATCAVTHLSDGTKVAIAQDITERKQAEQALRESEERFRELAENINEVFWVWTATPGNARCLYVSPAYATIWGHSCESLYSSPQSWREALHPQDAERVMEEGAHMDFENIADWTYRIVRPDQSVRWIRDRMFPVRDGSGAVVRFAGIAHDITESKEAEQTVRKTNRQLRNLSRRRIQEQEDERRRLSRELHDQIGQSLTAAKINVEVIRTTENPACLGRIEETIAILDQLLGQVRQISLDLRPPMLDDLGLVPALRSFIDEQGRRASIAVRFSAEQIPVKLDPEIQITCFRIAQEAITNAVRHAKATQLVIALRCTPGRELRLLAHDDGIGFDARAKQVQAVDLGLTGIRERAALVGGRAKIISSPRKGTTIDVSLPLTFRGERQTRRM